MLNQEEKKVGGGRRVRSQEQNSFVFIRQSKIFFTTKWTLHCWMPKFVEKNLDICYLINTVEILFWSTCMMLAKIVGKEENFQTSNEREGMK
jgi:hypothetical protein